MSHVKHPAQKHVGFERCPQCQGAFFDAGELEDLRDFTLGERIRAFLGA
jgi:Zn-finger nucleic acid-binding protein